MEIKPLVVQWGYGLHAEMLKVSRPIHYLWATRVCGGDYEQSFEIFPTKPGDFERPGDAPPWGKLAYILQIMNDPKFSTYTHIVWMDSDAVLYNAKDVREIIRSGGEADLYALMIHQLVFGGFFIVKNTVRMRDILQEIWDRPAVSTQEHPEREIVSRWYGTRYDKTEEVGLSLAIIEHDLKVFNLPREWHDFRAETNSWDEGSKNSIIRHFSFIPADTKFRRIKSVIRKWFDRMEELCPA